MADSGIYRIRNTVNGKQYIGSAVNFSSRWSVHAHHLKAGTHHCAPLQASWNKHGSEAFEFHRMIVCPKEMLTFYEQRAIDIMNPEYNVARVAGRTTGYKHTEETKAKFHLRRKAVITDEVRRKISAANVGKKISDEQKITIAKTLSGRKHTTKRRINQSLAKIGIVNTGRSKPVFCIQNGVTYASAAEAARQLGIKVSAAASYISAAADGKYKDAYGYSWKRA